MTLQKQILVVVLSTTVLYSLNLKAVAQSDICFDIDAPDQSEFSEASVIRTDKQWPNGSTITVQFQSGSFAQIDAVMDYASEWTELANLEFTEISSGAADIRVNIDASRNHWSYIGTGAQNLPDSEPTMNLGVAGYPTNSPAFKRVVLHEFGHAIGLVHEHLSPEAGICWDRPVVYNDYFNRMGWSRQKVDNNLFITYATNSINASDYDPSSIMHYPVERRHLTCDQDVVGWSSELSQTDKDFIKISYPETGTGPGTTLPEDESSGGGPIDPLLPILLLGTLGMWRKNRV